MKQYFSDVILKKNPEYLTEKQLIEGGGIMMDIDLYFTVDITERLINSDHITDLVCCLCDTLKKIYKIDTHFPLFILQKPNVNCLDIKTKDGIHIIISIESDLIIQKYIRDELLKIAETGELFHDLPLINSLNDVFDNAVSSGSNAFQM